MSREEGTLIHERLGDTQLLSSQPRREGKGTGKGPVRANTHHGLDLVDAQFLGDLVGRRRAIRGTKR